MQQRGGCRQQDRRPSATRPGAIGPERMEMRSSVIGAMTAAVIAVPAIAAPNAPAPRHAPAVVEHYVDINSAGSTELMTLPGIGAAEAEAIIAHRPYLTKTE